MKKTVFIHGILRRSGTNYLNQLLLLYPDIIQPNKKIRENWFLSYIDHINSFCMKLDIHWSNTKWKGAPYSLDDLKLQIGDSLLRYLKNEEDFSNKILITKTPSFQNIHLLSTYFPNSKQILIVRNPFDISASAFKTWNVPIKKSLNDWYLSCEKAYKLEQLEEVLVIRYEDLYLNTKKIIVDCLNYLELEIDSYNWNEFETIPIIGSSDERGMWKITNKKDNFKGISKWEELSESLKTEMYSNNNESINAYFGYDEFFVTKKIKDLPDYNTRLKIGKSIFDFVECNTDVTQNKRLQQFKQGAKLIFKSLKP